MSHVAWYNQLTEIPAGAGVPGPISNLTYKPFETIEEVRAAAQLAIQVEWTTIPAYLAALYSIQDAGSSAYQALRSVVVEEMFHINQAANILVGIGGRPKFAGEDVVPKYPTHLPSSNKRETPFIGLYRASPAVFRTVFMGIEAPAPYEAPPQNSRYTSIAQLYKALEIGLETMVAKYGADAVFQEAEGAEQRTDIYLGKFGGRAIQVRDLASAKEAILQIVQQGEGAVHSGQTMVPLQPWGSKNHYGDRVDGTYGPILGTPYELSHYFKFQQVANSTDFPGTFPIISNPKAEDFTNPKAQVKNFLFNAVYTVMLRLLEQTFDPDYGGKSLYFKTVLPLMHNAMPQLARELMQTPVSIAGDKTVGPNAAPTFEFVDGLDLEKAEKALISYITGKPIEGELSEEILNAITMKANTNFKNHNIDEGEIFKGEIEFLSQVLVM